MAKRSWGKQFGGVGLDEEEHIKLTRSEQVAMEEERKRLRALDAEKAAKVLAEKEERARLMGLDLPALKALYEGRVREALVEALVPGTALKEAVWKRLEQYVENAALAAIGLKKEYGRVEMDRYNGNKGLVEQEVTKELRERIRVLIAPTVEAAFQKALAGTGERTLVGGIQDHVTNYLRNRAEEVAREMAAQEMAVVEGLLRGVGADEPKG